MGRNLDNDIFEKAHFIATKSTMVHKHGAIIIKNGNIIGEGYNYNTKWMSHSYSIHAEVSALLNIPKKIRNRKHLEDSIMLVIRIEGKDNHYSLSAPCVSCRREIERYGIKRVFYSTKEM